MYLNLDTYKTKYKSDDTITPKNVKNKKRFIPDANIKASQAAKIRIDCPISGCDINKIIIGKINKKLKKYFKYKLLALLEFKIEAIMTITKGFKISTG